MKLKKFVWTLPVVTMAPVVILASCGTDNSKEKEEAQKVAQNEVEVQKNANQSNTTKQSGNVTTNTNYNTSGNESTNTNTNTSGSAASNNSSSQSSSTNNSTKSNSANATHNSLVSPEAKDVLKKVATKTLIGTAKSEALKIAKSGVPTGKEAAKDIAKGTATNAGKALSQLTPEQKKVLINTGKAVGQAALQTAKDKLKNLKENKEQKKQEKAAKKAAKSS